MSFSEVLPIWWSMIWRGYFGISLAVLVIGFLNGFLSEGLNVFQPISIGFGNLELIGGALISLWAMRDAINVHNLRPKEDEA